MVVSATQAALSAGAVAALATVGTPEYAELTAALALLVGGLMVLAGLFRLGVLAQFFSPSVLVGFVTGLALVISISRSPKILGIEEGEGDFWERLWDIIVHLGDVNWTTLAIGLSTIAVMVAVERFAHRLPAALVALMFGIVIARVFDLAAHGVAVIEEIPSGLAGPQIPDVSLVDLSLLLASAVGIALVNFAEGNSIAREFARRDGVKLDANQELVGVGAANVGAGLFQGFTIGASLSKSSAADGAGMQTQMAGVVAAGLTVVVALFLTDLFSGLPEATLGGIVLVAVSGMIKTRRIRELTDCGRPISPLRWRRRWPCCRSTPSPRSCSPSPSRSCSSSSRRRGLRSGGSANSPAEPSSISRGTRRRGSTLGRSSSDTTPSCSSQTWSPSRKTSTPQPPRASHRCARSSSTSS